jgi:hypothetical protein
LVGVQAGQGVIGQDRIFRESHLLELLQDEMLNQSGYVLLALPKGWYHDGEDIEPKVEVLTKTSLGDQFFQGTMGGGDHADIHFYGPGAADGFELLFLEYAQDPYLGIGRQ